jgi:hypothetical protein
MAVRLNRMRGFALTQADAPLDFELVVGLGARDAREWQ